MKSVVVGSIAMLSLMTFGGADKAADALPHPEYPRPQFVREAWINLNGKWSFEFDFGQSGTHEGRMLQK